MRFRFVPKSTTLNDLEGPLRTLFQNICPQPTTKIWMKIDSLSAAQINPVTLVSGNIRFVRIFEGVLWKGGIKFSMLLVTVSSEPLKIRPTYYIAICSPLSNFHWPPKYMTLNGQFTFLRWSIFDHDHFGHFADEYHCFFIVSHLLYYQVKLTLFHRRRLTTSMSGTIKQLNKILFVYAIIMVNKDFH